MTEIMADCWEGTSERELAAHWHLPEVRLYSVLGSTSDLARRLAVEGAPAGTLVLADEQRAGRGRGAHSWSSPPGVGLWCSFIFRGTHPDEVGRLPIRIALAAARALDPWTDGAVKVKWPNDLFLGVHKFGGILCEASWEGPRLDHVIVGIGLNLLQAEDEFPEPLRPLATSIRVFTGRSVSRFDVATAVISALRPFATGAHPLGPDRIVENFASRDYLNGRYVEILEPESGRSLAAGYANGIHADGALRVESPEGLVMVRSGTVRIGG